MIPIVVYLMLINHIGTNYLYSSYHKGKPAIKSFMNNSFKTTFWLKKKFQTIQSNAFKG